ncbi:hypothetical protein M1L60_17120 [Actinoplanes sp. TRM 88003]|uniref:Uncharacterized protein n=1 Tax=Paractinoplanes aksuensis TaxID=2939490 RepID=A0ABT1DN96_9ACTN|nr:hypothetical protein [Actinoplanes aksuensis]MCO8272317.1 hypothetical protein [Actinoplanes aksuensis]
MTSYRPNRITGSDRTGTAYAVVDPVGRFVDIGLRPGWWRALGPARVAAGLLEALESARMSAALAPLVERGEIVDAARGRITEAYRLIDEGREQPALRVIIGPRGLFRLHVRGGRIESAETGPLTPADTDRLGADARDCLTELARPAAGAECAPAG